MPLPHVCGVKTRPAASTSAGQPGQAGDAARAHTVGLEHVEAVPRQQLADS